MTDSSKPIIAVFGASGNQGGGVVEALQRRGKFRVRALTRKPAEHEGLADEVVHADLDDPDSLGPALKGVYGVFLMTNFWEGADEPKQARAAVRAAKDAGVKHLVWSTLPHVESISNGKYDVEHFTNKAKADAFVEEASFDARTFVEPPFYYQNLTGMMRPQQEGDSLAWKVPMDPDANVLHMGDVTEMGELVARAFEQPERVGGGAHLGFVGETNSWNGLAEILNRQGHSVKVDRVSPETYDQFFEAAPEMRQMMQYFEEHTYFGPGAQQKIGRAREILPQPPSSFGDWAKANFTV